MAIESGKIHPGTGASVTGVDGGAIFLLGSGVVFVFLGDARDHPVCHRRIQRRDQGSLGARFVFAAADDCGSFQIELGEIGAGFPTVGRQLDGAFEFGANFFGEAGGAEKAGAIRLLAVDAAQPEVIETVVGRERDGFFASGNAGIPGAELEMSAAEQVVGFRGGCGVDLLLERLNRLIDAAGWREGLAVSGRRWSMTEAVAATDPLLAKDARNGAPESPIGSSPGASA